MFENADKLFIVWNTKADGSGTNYEVGKPVTMGTVLYAQWTDHKMTMNDISYMIYGLQLYITDDARSFEQVGKSETPLSEKGLALLTLTGWNSVELIGNTFHGNVDSMIGPMIVTLEIEATGMKTNYPVLDVNSDINVATIGLGYDGDVTLTMNFTKNS